MPFFRSDAATSRPIYPPPIITIESALFEAWRMAFASAGWRKTNALPMPFELGNSFGTDPLAITSLSYFTTSPLFTVMVLSSLSIL